jgi:iron complex outermembrane receptor protein
MARTTATAPRPRIWRSIRGSFKFANVHGPYESDWNSFTAEANLDVDLGDGKLTNIIGWRKFETVSHSDADGTPMATLGTENYIWQHQFSNEFRYAGTFGRLKVTTGLFYFTQYMRIQEGRFLGATTLKGGGRQSTESVGLFMAGDYAITDTLTLNGGARYSYESKRAQVANIDATANCDLATLQCATYLFTDHGHWSDVSPRIGFQWKPVRNVQLYGYYAKGFRSGCYNLRQTNPLASPGPFNPEVQHAFEVGLKSDLFDRKVRFNAALFLNKVKDLQRSVIVADPNVGLVQVLTNTADADISGFEAELNLNLIPHLLISGNVGYVHNKFKKVLYDLSNDGVLDEKDYHLLLPRLYPWTYSVSVVHDMELGDLGTLNSRVSYNHRDAG